MNETIEDFLIVAKRAALNASKIILDFQKKSLEVNEKIDGSSVSKADIEAEKKIREIISLNYPNHKITGEELGMQNKDSNSDYLWAVDPIDGTSAYLNQEPTFSVSIALLKGNEPVLGLVYNPCVSELYTACNGSSKLNRQELPLIKNKKMENATVNYKLPRGDRKNLETLAVMESDRAIDRLVSQRGSPAYELALVAKGSHDFLVFGCSRKPKPEDYSAGVLLVRNAGGVVTDLEGKDIDPLTEDKYLIAGADLKNHEEFLEMLHAYGFGEKTPKGKIVYLGGFYGTGKSTVAMKLEEKLGYTRFNADLTRRELTRAGYDLKDADTIWGTIFWKAGWALQEGKGIIMESTYLNEVQRKPDYDLGRSKYAEGMIIEVICPEEITKQRISSRPVSPDGIHVPTNRIEYYDKKKDDWTAVIPGLMKADRAFVSYMIYDSNQGKLYEGLIRAQHKAWANEIANCLGTPIQPKNPVLLNLEKRYNFHG